MDATRPRLCHLRKWPDFPGYGFNLHAEKGKAGQYIGTIDSQSPSEAAGLRAGDRIVEVNGVNIGSENHQQVVQRIKSVPNETRLLVVDADTDAFYRNRNIVVRGDTDDVLHLKTPVVNPYTGGSTSESPSVGQSPHSSTASESRDSVSNNLHGYMQVTHQIHLDCAVSEDGQTLTAMDSTFTQRKASQVSSSARWMRILLQRPGDCARVTGSWR